MITLIELKNFRKALVIDIVGGSMAKRKLENLGIRVGSIIVKKGPSLGPVVVNSGNTQIAIGRGLASKILVKEL